MNLRSLFNFLIPGSILTAGALLLIMLRGLSGVTLFQVEFASLLLFFLSLLLAWRFDRSRVVYALQLLLLSAFAGRSLIATPLDATGTLIVTLLLTNFCLLALIRERGIHSLRGLLVLSFPVAQACVLYVGLQRIVPVIDWLQTPLIRLPSPLDLFPPSVYLLLLIALLIQGVRFLRYPNPLEGALFWTVVATMASFACQIPLSAALFRFAAVLGILISFIEMSYTLAYRDELTGLPGRRALMETFRKLGGRYAIAMVDIDFFKKLNDRFGHDVGDEVLKMVATRLARCTGGGRAFRYGGEEFCMVFSGRDLDACLRHLELLRTRIAGEPFIVRSSARPLKKPATKQAAGKRSDRSRDCVTVTVSIGAAERSSLNPDPFAVMKSADQELYRAKKGGRNRVVPAPPKSSDPT